MKMIKKFSLVFFIFFVFQKRVLAADIVIAAPNSTPQNFTLNNQKLIISAGGNLTVDTAVNSAAAISDNNNTGLQIQVDANSGEGIFASGNSFGAVEITGTARLSSLVLNSGLITSDKLSGSTILLSGGGGTTGITTAAGTTISNSASSGIAINSNTATNTPLTITNAGTISVNNDVDSIAINLSDSSGGSSLVVSNNTGLITAGTLGTAIKVTDSGNSTTINNSGGGSIIGAIVLNGNSTTITNNSTIGITGNITAIATNLDITNTAGAINGNVNLGTSTSSTFLINGGSVTGNVTMGSASQTLTFGGGTLAGTIDGLGRIVINTPSYTLNGNIGASTNTTSVTINAGNILDVATNNNSITTTTLVISSGASLNLGSTAVTGIIQGSADNFGTVNLSANYTLNGVMGNSTRSLAAINLSDGKTLTAGAQGIDANVVSLGNGSNLILANSTLVGAVQGTTDGIGAISFTENFTAGGAFGTSTNSLASLTISDGKTLTTGANNIDATIISLGTSSTLTLATGTVTGLIRGSTDGVGTVSVTQNLTANNDIGSSTNSLATVAVSSNRTLDLAVNNVNIDATSITLNSSSILNVGSGTLTGLVQGLTDGRGIVNFLDNHVMTNDAGTAANSLALVTIADGKTLTSGAQIIDSTAISIGSASFLALGSGVVTGLIRGSADNVGTVHVTDNNTLNGNIGSVTNSLASVTIDAGKTLTANTRAIDANNISLNSGSILTMTTGAITGVVDGTAAGIGTVNLNGTVTIAAGTLLGSTNGLAAVNVGNAAVITANDSIKTTTLTIGGGTSGSLNLAAGKIISGNVAINSGATLTLNDAGSFVSGTILGVTDGSGTLSLAQDFTTTANIGSTSNSLATVSIATNRTLTLENTIDATTISMGSGTTLNYNSGTIIGTIQGSANNRGTVNFNRNISLSDNIGTASNSLSVINLLDNKTLNAGSFNLDAATINLNSGSILNISSGSLVGLTRGFSDNVGTINFLENNSLGGNLGSATNSLLLMTIADGKNLSTANRTMDINLVTVGSGSTITFGTGSLTGFLRPTSDGAGSVIFSEHYTLNGDIGSASNSFADLTIIAGKIVTMGAHTIDAGVISMQLDTNLNLNASSVLRGVVEPTTSGYGIVNFSGNNTIESGTILGRTNSLSSVNIGAGAEVNFNESIRANNVSIDSGANLMMRNNSTIIGGINGASDGVGSFTLADGSSTISDVGNSHALANFTVANGATLTFSGTNLNATDVTVQGTLDLGDSSKNIGGNLSGSGSAIFDLGSAQHFVSNNFNSFSGDIIKIEITGATTLGRISASGIATVNTGTNLAIAIDTSASYITNGTTYQIISGGTGSDINSISENNINVNGSGSNKSGLLTFMTTADSNNELILNITAQRSSASTNSSTQSVAEVIDEIGNASSGNLRLLQQYLDSSSTSDPERDMALKSVSPQVDNSANSFTITSASIGAAEDRLGSLRMGSGTGISSGDEIKDRGIWIQAFGTSAQQNSSKRSAGYSSNSMGTAVGADKDFGDDLHFGLSLTYAHSNIKSKFALKKIQVDTYQINAYGSKNFNQFYVDAILGFAWSQYHSNRAIPVIGVVASGKYSGQTYIIKTEIGSVQNLPNNFNITPFAAITAARDETTGYNESGAGTLNLQIDRKATEFLELRAGLGFGYNALTYKQTHINLRLRTSYGYDFTRTKQTAESNFVGHTNSFESGATNIYQGSTKIGLGVDILQINGLTFIADYAFEMRTSYRAHFGMLRLRYNY